MAEPNGAALRAELLRLDSLPPLSFTATRLLELSADPNIDADGLAALIEQDPGLTARIIGVANSAFFRRAVPAHRIRDAIVRLGFNMVCGLALGIATSGSFQASRCPGFDAEAYWLEAMGSALLGRMVAQNLPAERERPAPDSVYLCGLLHNLGLLVLAHLFPDRLAGVLAAGGADPDADETLLERAQVGIDRWEAGSWMAFRWDLPEPVAEVIAGLAPDVPARARRREAVLVGAARAALRRTGHDAENGIALDPTETGLGEEACDKVVRQFRGGWEELRAVARLVA